MEGLARHTIYGVNPNFSAFPSSFNHVYSVIAAQLDQRTPKLQTTAMASRTHLPGMVQVLNQLLAIGLAEAACHERQGNCRAKSTFQHRMPSLLEIQALLPPYPAQARADCTPI
jgi:hypothetical protein